VPISNMFESVFFILRIRDEDHHFAWRDQQPNSIMTKTEHIEVEVADGSSLIMNTKSPEKTMKRVQFLLRQFVVQIAFYVD
jgi:hypothetical protein